MPRGGREYLAAHAPAPAARIIATMPDRNASGSVGHAVTTAAKSGSFDTESAKLDAKRSAGTS
jgi:hypothetical protein